MKGTVVKNTGNHYLVKDATGNTWECKIKGNFRTKGMKTTNPIAIGDNVGFSILKEENIGLIDTIEDRKNCIIRKSVNLSKQKHIIAANIDKAFLVVSMFQPRTPFGFIDRFLVTAKAYQIPAILVFNKIDIYDEESEKIHQFALKIYKDAGYECIDTSAIRGDNIALLKSAMLHNTSLFSGNSGVGKSELIKRLDPSVNLKVGTVSEFHHKGKHTTTFAEMYTLEFGANIIDTPGIKEFGMFDFKKEEVALYFPEMKKFIHECKYYNCTHVHEPECAVKKAVADGQISEQRYKSYLNILNGKEMDVEQWELK